MEQSYRLWLAQGGNASMQYLADNLEKRFDPRLLVEGVKSIVSVALNYYPQQRLAEGEPQIADYALGLDYHDVVKNLLRQLAEALGITEYRVFCDSAPVLERYWAEQSGLGWIGRNQQLIIPNAGSEFFLGELFIPYEVDHYDSPIPSRCGNCHKCLDACPTGALADGKRESFSSEKCLSYQTIENRDELSPLAKEKMGDTFYGCDRCQRACPWNSFAQPTAVAEFQPKPELLTMTRNQWLTLTEDQYRQLFKGSAIKRAKYTGIKRNIGNLPQPLPGRGEGGGIKERGPCH